MNSIHVMEIIQKQQLQSLQSIQVLCPQSSHNPYG